MASPDTWPRYTTNIPYSDASSLNTLETCVPNPPSLTEPPGYWLIYIHGGAWRDPAIDSTSYHSIRETLLSSKNSLITQKISGYASLNYRLSPYPSHPTNPSDPSDPARNAQHPDHITDVLTALLYLQETYHFEDRYILVGHSAGAMLAMQVAMKRYWGAQYESTFALELNVVPPVAVVGLEGVYDLPAWVEYHAATPVYREFVTNAFGSNGWEAASPVSGEYEGSWPDGRLVVLAHSPGDSLVEVEQAEAMRRTLLSQDWREAGVRSVQMFTLQGEHDEVWQSGDAARAVEFALEELGKMHIG